MIQLCEICTNLSREIDKKPVNLIQLKFVSATGPGPGPGSFRQAIHLALWPNPVGFKGAAKEFN